MVAAKLPEAKPNAAKQNAQHMLQMIGSSHFGDALKAAQQANAK